MPSYYSKNFRNATRAAYAREAVLDAFGRRAIRALDEPDFEDRESNEVPRLSPVSWRRETNGTKHVELADLIGRGAA